MDDNILLNLVKDNHTCPDKYSNTLSDLLVYYDDIYKTLFAPIFDEVSAIKYSLTDKYQPITDAELEWVITALPLELFEVSESLNKITLIYQAIKVCNKDVRLQEQKSLNDMLALGEIDLTKSEIKDTLDSICTKYDMLPLVYKSIIDRVESQISLSKELIMGCKKVWDARRSAEESSPINPVDTDKQVENDLPVYPVDK